MSGTFNLNGLIRAVCDESDEADPALIAKLVQDRIRRTDRDTALAQALPHLVRAQFRRSATSFLPSDPRSAQRETGTQGCRGAAGPTSRKVTAIRDAWRAVLRQRVSVGGEYKLLAACTVADLEVAAKHREDHARQTFARAEQLRTLAGLLTEHGCRTVAELPDAVLQPALAAAA